MTAAMVDRIRRAATTADRAGLLRHGAVLAFRSAAALAQFVVTVAIAKATTSAEAGIVFTVIGLVMVASTLARLGLASPIARNVAAGRAGRNPARTRGALDFLLVTSVVIWLALGVVLLLTESSLLGMAEGSGLTRRGLWFGWLAVLPWALVVVAAETLKGLGKPVAFQTARGLAIPSTAAVAVTLLSDGTSTGTLGAYLVACWAAALVTVSWAEHNLPGRILSAVSTGFEEMGPFIGRMLTVGLANQTVAWAAPAVAALNVSTDEVARLATAQRVSMLAALPLFAVNSVIGPRMAHAFELRDERRLLAEHRKSAIVATALCLPLASLLLTVPGRVLSMNGAGYTAGAAALRIFTLGQVADVVTGSAAEGLIAKRTTTSLTVGALGSAAIMLAGGLVLGRWFGIEGVAAAVSLGIGFRSGLNWLVFQRSVRSGEAGPTSSPRADSGIPAPPHR